MIVTLEKASDKIIHIGTGIAIPEKYSPTQVNGPMYMLTQNGHLRSLEQRSIERNLLKISQGPRQRVIKIVTR